MSPLPSSCLHALRSPVRLPPALGSLRVSGVAPAFREEEEEVFTRDKQGGSVQKKAVFTCGSIVKEDPPKVHQAVG